METTIFFEPQIEDMLVTKFGIKEALSYMHFASDEMFANSKPTFILVHGG